MSEFILPLLILDRLCFGTHKEETAIRKEFFSILSFEPSSSLSMSQSDHQRAVSSLFMVIDTLNYWAERETEDRYRSSRSSNRRKSNSSKKMEDIGDVTSWPADKTIARIEDLLSSIPLSVQAGAAANTGMHARALRLLEMAGRKLVVDDIYEASLGNQKKSKSTCLSNSSFQSSRVLVGNSDDVNLMKDILARLDDCETMVSIGGNALVTNPILQVRDSIRQKEASGDFEGALRDYERALQLESVESRGADLENGVLTCLLELGQFESVLNQTSGLMHRDERKGKDARTKVSSFAVEAAWRLGRWETLSDLIENDTGLQNSHEIALGKAMLGLHKKDNDMVSSAIECSRDALMQSLSSAARESYSRSYADIVRLQSVRELENASAILCSTDKSNPFTLDEIAHSTANEGWAWDGRLDLLSPNSASSVISTRVALARLCEEPALEGSLFLGIGNRARKNGLYSKAENFFSNAEQAFASIPSIEFTKNSGLGNLVDCTLESVAKLKHESGQSSLALKILGHESVQNAINKMVKEFDNFDTLKSIAVDFERQKIILRSGSTAALPNEGEDTLSGRFARRLLQLTQWTVEGGLKGGSEITKRYKIVHKLAPEFEKGKQKM